jgi:hypothetical protein
VSISDVSSRTTQFLQATFSDDCAAIADSISNQKVEIRLDPDWGRTLDGQLCFFLVISILIRLDKYCPNLFVSIPALEVHPQLKILGSGNLQDRIREFFNGMPSLSRAEFATLSGDGMRLACSQRGNQRMFNVANHGWAVYWNATAPSPKILPNPVGASFAGVLAANEVFKRLLQNKRLRPGNSLHLSDSLVFNTYNYSNDGVNNPDCPQSLNLRDTTFVGLGGVASALLLVLSVFDELDGATTLIDPDVLDTSNLNRHLISSVKDVGRSKVEIASSVLSPNLCCRPVQQRYGRYVADLKERRMPLVVISVDHDSIRREVQSDLPKVILNAGTGDIAWRVSRHTFPNLACLSCISRADASSEPVLASLAMQLGLPYNILEQYWQTKEPISQRVLESSTRQDIGDKFALWAGKTLREIRQVMCANPQLLIDSDETVSMPALSALPGILLASELVKELSFPSTRPFMNDSKNHFLTSVLSYPSPDQLDVRKKVPDCGCADEARQKYYKQKWN